MRTLRLFKTKDAAVTDTPTFVAISFNVALWSKPLFISCPFNAALLPEQTFRHKHYRTWKPHMPRCTTQCDRAEDDMC